MKKLFNLHSSFKNDDFETEIPIYDATSWAKVIQLPDDL
jgi:hypothetical protein